MPQPRTVIPLSGVVESREEPNAPQNHFSAGGGRRAKGYWLSPEDGCAEGGSTASAPGITLLVHGSRNVAGSQASTVEEYLAELPEES